MGVALRAEAIVGTLLSMVYEIVTVAAILAGPILAVQAQSWLERRREQRDRKLRVFRTLMATRARKAASPSHVEALNLISIEFHDDKEVRAAWNVYLDHLMTGPASDVWVDKMQDLFTELLFQMAESLRFDFDKVQIKKQGYTPVLYENLESEQALLRQGLIGVLTGRGSIPIHVGGQPFVPPVLPNPMAALPDKKEPEDGRR
jgi:hypothetical protein